MSRVGKGVRLFYIKKTLSEGKQIHREASPLKLTQFNYSNTERPHVTPEENQSVLLSKNGILL